MLNFTIFDDDSPHYILLLSWALIAKDHSQQCILILRSMAEDDQ